MRGSLKSTQEKSLIGRCTKLTVLTAMALISLMGCSLFQKPDLRVHQESLLVKCPSTYPQANGKTGKDWIQYSKEWKDQYNNCAIPHNGLVDSMVVKGGPNYNVYDYLGSLGLASGGNSLGHGVPHDDGLLSPLTNKGNQPGMSHVNACLEPLGDVKVEKTVA